MRENLNTSLRAQTSYKAENKEKYSFRQKLIKKMATEYCALYKSQQVRDTKTLAQPPRRPNKQEIYNFTYN
jgi:hypothetical protein